MTPPGNCARPTPPLSEQELLRLLRLPSAVNAGMRPDASQYLKEADKELEAHQSHIEDIFDEQAAIRRNVSRYISLNAPIRRMPSEILHHVFVLAAAGWNIFGVGVAEEHPSIMGESVWKSTAFTLSRVCSRWREIAITTPQIWSSIAIRVCKRASEPTRLCILRSGNQPLLIYIEDYMLDRHTESIDYLLQTRNRLAYIDVENAGPRIPVGLGQHALLPALRSAVYCGWPEQASLLQRHLAGSQTLDSLTLGFPNGRILPYKDSLPLHRLRNLTARHWGSQAILKLAEALRACHNLESLTCRSSSEAIVGEIIHWEDADTYGPLINRPPPVTCAALTSLSIILYDRFGIYTQLNDLVSCLTLPSLTHLSIRGGCRPDVDTFAGTWPRVELESFISRSQCSLRTLVLEEMPLVDSEVLALLHFIPTLEDLTIHELWTYPYTNLPESLLLLEPQTRVQTVTRELMKGLHSNECTPDQPVVPNLRRLRLKVRSHFDAGKMFVDMVKSRWCAPSSRLREVELDIQDIILDARTYEPLKRLDEEGMMVSVLGLGQRVV
ncbi:hypothetical protein V5O48_003897 [Marasmius crinis-equi]|uniref:F-box domain-containing protein n=1 Tax=Marasmius crinis-equi TaxID=585013 RepID=A0ABR3FRJ9_9AGAR